MVVEIERGKAMIETLNKISNTLEQREKRVAELEARVEALTRVVEMQGELFQDVSEKLDTITELIRARGKEPNSQAN